MFIKENEINVNFPNVCPPVYIHVLVHFPFGSRSISGNVAISERCAFTMKLIIDDDIILNIYLVNISDEVTVNH